jgi:hypothetical protein
MELHATARPYFNGTTVHLVVTRDTTESKHAERAGLLLAAIIDSSDDEWSAKTY